MTWSSGVVAQPSTRRRFEAFVGGVAVTFGPGESARLQQLLDRLGLGRPGLVCSASLAQARPDLVAAAGSAGAFCAPRVHVPPESIDAARHLLSEAETVVAMGGGSAIGLGKVLAVTASIPLVAVPTTYSGSEMTSLYGFREGTRKIVRRAPHALPRAVIYDPDLTATLPPHAARASIINCLAHGIDTAWCKGTSPLSLAAARGSIEAIAVALAAEARDEQAAARAALLEAAWLGGVALASGQLGLHHTICHSVGGLTGASHGDINAVVLPAVMRFNAEACDIQELLVRPLFGASFAREAAAAHDVVAALCREWSLPAKLRDLGLREPELALVAEDAAARDGSRANPRPVSADILFELLREVY